MAKKKKLTNREKKLHAEAKKELQAKGAIPPDKPKLNRKKFIDGAKAEWNSREECYVWDAYMMQAMSYMLGHMEKGMRLSREAVGAAKVLKIAMRLREFYEGLKAKGEHEYKVADQYNYIKDILDA